MKVADEPEIEASNAEHDWDDRDDDFETADAQEETDGSAVSVEDFDGLVLAPSDWTVGTIYQQIGKQIDLDPAFQRRNVWSTSAKSKFIESIFLGVPVPQILLSSKKNTRNSFLVLDGKQRLTTIKEFMDGKFSNGRRFNLRSISVLKDTIGGKNWDNISKEEEWKDRFENATLRTAVLKGWENESVLYEIFYRLNSGSVKLSPMELRMSLHPGDFLKFIIGWTERIGPLHHLIKKQQPDPRMGDVELSIRHLAFSDRGFIYNGNLKEFLDRCCIDYNDKFKDDEFRNDVDVRLDGMNEAIQAGMDIFGDNHFCRKWAKGSYERQFNRAIFDVLVGSLINSDFRIWALNNTVAVTDAYINLCSNNNEFIRSIESTTKTNDNTRTRYTLWYETVRQISGINIDIPEIA